MSRAAVQRCPARILGGCDFPGDPIWLGTRPRPAQLAHVLSRRTLHRIRMTDGWTWYSAMLELYPPEVFVTPTKLLPPTVTPTLRPSHHGLHYPRARRAPDLHTQQPSNPTIHANANEHSRRQLHPTDDYSMMKIFLALACAERRRSTLGQSDASLGTIALAMTSIVLLILFLASCTPSVPAGETGPTPTAVLAGEAATQLPAESEPRPTPTIAPFRFVLPTPGAEPVSGWRPPLYPCRGLFPRTIIFISPGPSPPINVNWPLAEYRYGGVFFAPNIVHTGVDIDAEEGTPILAAGPGTVISAGWGLFTEAPKAT